MPNYQAVSRHAFAQLRWQRYSDYHFAAADAVSALVAQEVARACMAMPLAFLRQEEQFVPAAIQGFKPGENLFVSADGRWLAGYVPAAYRSYPFALASTENEQLVLCIDTDSGLVSETGQEPFFEENGDPSPAVRDILSFLEQVHHNREMTRRLCAVLESHQLIQPWPLHIHDDTREEIIGGLFRIDEAALNALDTDSFDAVRRSGALPLAYCQLLSMQHVQPLAQLTHNRPTTAPADLDIGGLLGESDDTLTFNF